MPLPPGDAATVVTGPSAQPPEDREHEHRRDRRPAAPHWRTLDNIKPRKGDVG